MPLSTFGVVSAVTPSVIETYFSHFLNRAPLRQKPTAHISYHEGLRLIREFLDYSAKHTVEDLQAFTAQWVPAPTWVRIHDVEIKAQYLERSARLLQEQLGPTGIELVGGTSWWRWRRPDAPCKAEWVEMKKDYNERKRSGGRCDKAILYVHGGAYYFGSVDEHRYQIQRHARKLKAKVFAPRYRLAPQFPFPCGLQDCIAAYFQLLEDFEPNQILFGGDSAGGGMVLSMLVTLRDQGQPLPAGTILLSPWVDLTHSFPSVAGDGAGDYIPPHGFHHKPSMVWPPPNTDELRDLAATPIKKKKSKDDLSSMSFPDQDRKVPQVDRDLSIYVNGERITIKDQIQMYTTNYMLAHPLVSPVQQASLGGLPPMLIQVGGAELLRDEQIYVAHKAANPTAYPPSQMIMNEYNIRSEDVSKYPPTDVQLQVWDDLCHVPHTLSFTRPAKYMYRSVAQFGAWALGQAQHQSVLVTDDDHLSIISSGPGTDNESTTNVSGSKSRNVDHVDQFRPTSHQGQQADGMVGRAGDPLPPFKNSMIRQRVDRHGVTYPLTSEAELPCLHLDPESIGAIKPGPVGKWLKYKKATDSKFSSDKKKVQKKRLKEMQQGYAVAGENEYPPPTALAGRRTADLPAEKRLKKSWGLAMWSGWGSSHDAIQIEREDKLERVPSNRPESSQPSNAVIANHEADTAGLKPFGGSATPESRQRGASSSSIFTDRSHMEERSVSPFVPGTDDVPASRYVLGGSNLRPPSASISRSVSRASSRYSATASHVNDDIAAPPPSPPALPPAASTGHADNTRNISDEYTLTSSALPRVNSPVQERVQSPTNDIVDEQTSQDITSSNLPDGPMAYPFKIRNPIPGYTSSAASSNGDANEGQTSSTLFPAAGSNGVAIPRSAVARPVSSLYAFSDKEFVIPAAEKEVALDSSPSPSTPTDGRNMPFRMRNAPADPRAARLDTNNLTPIATNTSMASSIPPSPAASYGGKAPDFQYRNPAFDPRNVAARVFGGSPQYEYANPTDQMRTAPPPKPVGFAYNPRDLRNAMLNRAAAESAAAASASRGQSPAPASAHSHQAIHPFGGAVELPATSVMSPVSHRPSYETLGRGSATSTNTRATSATGTSNLNDFQIPDTMPVELPADPASLRPIPAAATKRSSPVSSFNRPDLAVRENITMPVVVDPPRITRPPPPPPPPLKDEPLAESRPPPAVHLARIPMKERSAPVEAQSSPGVQANAPVIGSLSGLGEGGSGFDLGLEGANHQDEQKAPAWL
jgi:acetyl esterase/lipase